MKTFYHTLSERQHRTKMLTDTVFVGYTQDEVAAMITDHSKVKKIESQPAGEKTRIVIRWNSFIDTLADCNEALGFVTYPRKTVIG